MREPPAPGRTCVKCHPATRRSPSVSAATSDRRSAQPGSKAMMPRSRSRGGRDVRRVREHQRLFERAHADRLRALFPRARPAAKLGRQQAVVGRRSGGARIHDLRPHPRQRSRMLNGGSGIFGPPSSVLLAKNNLPELSDFPENQSRTVFGGKGPGERPHMVR
jgi:hypothetical protein